MLTTDVERNRHSMAHILAQALLRIYPDGKLGIGPVVKESFYYEIETDSEITEEDFGRIEQEMWSIVKANYPINQIIVTKEEALGILLHQGQIYKTEILNEIESNEVSLYKTGDEFIDLCSGPHVASTSHVGFFKLMSIEKGHWRGQTNRPVMQKIYGVGFMSREELNNYLNQQQQLKESTHKKIGPKLGYFLLDSSDGNVFPLWLSKGKELKRIIENMLLETKRKFGFTDVETPTLIEPVSQNLEVIDPEIRKQIMQSISINETTYIPRPDMTPAHYQIFKSKMRGYSELPIRLSEIGQIFRKELDNENVGITRTPIYTGEQITVFSTEEDLFNELLNIFQLATKFLNKLGFDDLKIQLSTDTTKDDKRFIWADGVLRKLIEYTKVVSRQLDDNITSNGPKLEIFIKDVFGKEWQISSIQLDIFSTIKHGLKYIDSHGDATEVVTIHATVIGSFERIIALLLEKYNGELPIFLSPEQIRVLPISRRYNYYAETVKDTLIAKGFRVGIDTGNETLQNKIRSAEESEVPFMLITGSKEESSKSVSVRPREGQDIGLMKISEFIEYINKEIPH